MPVEERDPSSGRTQEVVKDGRRLDLDPRTSG
jgi:hypothetical protein